MKLEKIGRKEINKLEPEILNALKTLNEKYGVSFRFDGGTIYEGYFDMKITVLLDGAKTLDQKMFDQEVKLHKLNTKQIWKIKDREFILSGYRPKATKNCFLITDIKTGKECVINLQTALSFFGTEKSNMNLIKSRLTQTDRNGNAIGE